MNNILDVATLLLLLCARCAEAGLSKRDRTDFVYRYNRLRAGEGGANVKKVYWDYALQKLANRAVRKCDYHEGFDQDNNYSSFQYPGELIWTGVARGIMTPLFKWKECDGRGKDCHSYKQFMYWNVSRIGCDKMLCLVTEHDSTDISFPNEQKYNPRSLWQPYWACFFGHKYERGEVFDEGKKCSNCPPGHMCNGGLCDSARLLG